MQCQEDSCKEIVVRVTRKDTIGEKTWFAVPKKGGAPIVDPLVPGNYKRDYLEAWAILDDSHRMSAVLSRKILADLLAEYAKLTHYKLVDAIDAFTEDTSHPKTIRDNLHLVREMGNFGAHTQRDSDGDVVEINRVQSEWTLKVVSDLFDYLIIDPKKDAAQRDELNKRLKAVGKHPISPLPEDSNA